MSRRAETNDGRYCRAVGEYVDNDDDNDIKEGMSDILIVCHLFILLLPLILFLLYYSP